MSTTSGRSVTLSFSGDVEYTQVFEAPDSSLGSGQNQLLGLSTGNNTITVPDNAVAVTIILPTGNAVQVTLKGINADTGIPIALIGPSSIGLQGVSSFVLNADSDITVRLIFS